MGRWARKGNEVIAWEMGVAAGRGLGASGGRLENGMGNQNMTGEEGQGDGP